MFIKLHHWENEKPVVLNVRQMLWVEIDRDDRTRIRMNDSCEVVVKEDLKVVEDLLRAAY